MGVNEIFKKALEESQKGNLEEAEKLYREALEISDLPEIWNNLGNVLRRMGRFGQAIEAYESALRLDPDYKTAKLNLGLTLLDLERYSDSMLILENLKMSGYSPKELEYALTVIYAKLGRYAQFLKLYRENRSEDLEKLLETHGVQPPKG